MRKLLELIISGHCHKWEIMHDNQLVLRRAGEIVEVGNRIIFKCTRCNKVKKIDIT